MEMYYHRSIRLQSYDYSRPGEYFVTICTENRECIFGNIINGKMILNNWGNVVNEYCLITENHFPNIKFDPFVIMPNHFHVIITIIDTCNPCTIINGKNPNANNATKKNTNSDDEHTDVDNANNGNKADMRGNPAPTLGQIVGFFKYGVSKQINKMRNTPGVKIWQRNYYERIIRNKNAYNNISKYIKITPLNGKWIY